MILRHKPPEARVIGVMAVVAHHPVVVHFKGIAVCLFAVDINVASLHFQFIVFVDADATLVNGISQAIKLYGPAFFRDNDWAVVINAPFVVGLSAVKHEAWRANGVIYISGINGSVWIGIGFSLF